MSTREDIMAGQSITIYKSGKLPTEERVDELENRYEGYAKLRMRNGDKRYKAVIVLRGRQRGTRRKFRQATKAIDYGHRLVTRCIRRQNTAELMERFPAGEVQAN